MAKPSQAHIPRRATQHGIFLSGSETAPPALKPGQTELFRQELYSTEAKRVEEPYLFQDQFKNSHYTTSIARITLPEDYEDPAKPFIPASLCRPNTVGTMSGGTEHWQSEYKASSNQADFEYADALFGTPYFPAETFAEPHALLGRGSMGSTYQEEFGRYRSNPRDKIGQNVKRPIDAGTAKGTMHIPGYQGFIPGNTFSDEVARVERGDFNRSVDKTNIEQLYHVNLIGYSGHEPKSAVNDRGGRHPTAKTVYGHDYPDPNTCHIYASLSK